MPTTTNCPPGCIPFDLITALKHPERVRDAHGAKARRVFHVPEVKPDCRVWILWNGHNVAKEYTETGLVYDSDPTPALFLTAPEPTYVPWDNVDEVPDGVWFRRKGEPERKFFNTLVDSEKLVIGGTWYTLPLLYTTYEWHTDRRHKGPWNACGKLAPQ